MKKLMTAALALSLMTGTVAMADPPDHRDHENSERRDDDRNDHRDDNRDEHRDEHHDRFRAGEYHRPRGYQTHAWHRGERLPSSYRNKSYVVHDYKVYRLKPPPRGHQWVRVDNDVVLVAVATGAVVEIVNNLFYQ